MKALKAMVLIDMLLRHERDTTSNVRSGCPCQQERKCAVFESQHLEARREPVLAVYAPDQGTLVNGMRSWHMQTRLAHFTNSAYP